MNKILSLKERIFSPSWTKWIWKIYLIFDWFKIGFFQPAFENFLNFYQHSQHLYSQVQRKNLKFTQRVDFDLIEKLP